MFYAPSHKIFIKKKNENHFFRKLLGFFTREPCPLNMGINTNQLLVLFWGTAVFGTLTFVPCSRTESRGFLCNHTNYTYTTKIKDFVKIVWSCVLTQHLMANNIFVFSYVYTHPAMDWKPIAQAIVGTSWLNKVQSLFFLYDDLCFFLNSVRHFPAWRVKSF